MQISWLLPTDLDLHCLLRQGVLCSAKEGLNKNILNYENGYQEEEFKVNKFMLASSHHVETKLPRLNISLILDFV